LHQANISLVQGIRNLLNKEIRRGKGSEDIKYYASGGSVAFSEKECVADCDIAISAKYDGFKMRCGWQEFNLDIKRVFSVNEYIKKNREQKDFSLMIDFIQGTLYPKFNLRDIEKYISEFKSLNILWFEEPLDPDNYSLYKNISHNYLFNFSLGESFSSLLSN
jgi:L-alanine-DL-glutamate epimerase-like enolase superfamily enzyme